MFYTRAEVLQKLQITPPTLYAFIKEGLLTKYRMAKGRVFLMLHRSILLRKIEAKLRRLHNGKTKRKLLLFT
jgi:predicted site-specific integrase-resolvase